MVRLFIAFFCLAVGTVSPATATCFLTCSRANTDGTTSIIKQCFQSVGWLVDLGACEKMARSLNKDKNVCKGEWAPFQTCDNPEAPPTEPSDIK